MRYLPKSAAERQGMLDSMGLESIEDLFRCIPEKMKLGERLDLPEALSEFELIDYFRARAQENAAGYLRFLGAGAYPHFRLVVVDAMISRGEFLTAYTPYQAEVSQGTLQAIFEFQTLICQLTGQEVANASMYDGSTALPEAVMMAIRLTRRNRVLLAHSVHPEYRQVFGTYAQSLNLDVHSLAMEESGQISPAQLQEGLDDETAAVVIQSPNFFGVIEDVAETARVAHERGALLIVVITEPVCLGLLRPPVEADIVAMEGQSFGLPVSYGGPYLGVIATKEKNVRQLPGRLAGMAYDAEGRGGFVLTLATREQHIRREKATSNICTNQALCALAATIHLCVLGKEGLREMAEQNLAKAHYAAAKLAKLPGVKLRFPDRFFNEFVVDLPKSPGRVLRKLLKKRIVGGLALERFYPEMKKCLLVCVTETASRTEIDQWVAGVRWALR